jgi:hypothetical protein
VRKVGDEDVIFIKVAHPAVINYIGEHADWVWDMIHKAQAVALMLAMLISQAPLISPTDVLQLAALMLTVKQEIDELISASSHSYYAGGMASKLHQYPAAFDTFVLCFSNEAIISQATGYAKQRPYVLVATSQMNLSSKLEPILITSLGFDHHPELTERHLRAPATCHS